jgi:hypothetical protein
MAPSRRFLSKEFYTRVANRAGEGGEGGKGCLSESRSHAGALANHFASVVDGLLLHSFAVSCLIYSAHDAICIPYILIPLAGSGAFDSADTHSNIKSFRCCK